MFFRAYPETNFTRSGLYKLKVDTEYRFRDPTYWKEDQLLVKRVYVYLYFDIYVHLA